MCNMDERTQEVRACWRIRTRDSGVVGPTTTRAVMEVELDAWSLVTNDGAPRRRDHDLRSARQKRFKGTIAGM